MTERRALLAEIGPRVAAVFAAITGGELPLDLGYDTCPELLAADAAALRARYLAERRRDLGRRSTSTGPHRDDLRITLAGHEAASFASQGQTRALVLAWKIAEMDLLLATHGDPPLLLLDDVSSELDETRNAYLFDHLSQRPGQSFITTTDPRYVRIADHRRDRVDHEVRAGVVSQVISRS